MVIVEADDVETAITNQYTDAAMEALEVNNCKDLLSNWPFDCVVAVEDFLVQVDPNLRGWPFAYLSLGLKYALCPSAIQRARFKKKQTCEVWR